VQDSLDIIELSSESVSHATLTGGKRYL